MYFTGEKLKSKMAKWFTQSCVALKLQSQHEKEII